MKFTNVTYHPTNVATEDGVVRVDPGASVDVKGDRRVELANENPRLRASSDLTKDEKAQAKQAPAAPATNASEPQVNPDDYTRAELDKLAADAGVEGSFKTKADVADALNQRTGTITSADVPKAR